MGSVQHLVRWLRDRTSRKKRDPLRERTPDRRSKTGSGPTGSASGSHRNSGFPKNSGPRKEQVCENALYSKTSAGTRAEGRRKGPGAAGAGPRGSPFRLLSDSPAHVYEEIPGALVLTEIPLDSPGSASQLRGITPGGPGSSPGSLGEDPPKPALSPRKSHQGQGHHHRQPSETRSHDHVAPDSEGTRLNISLQNLDFTEAKEVGPYLVVPIRKQTLTPGTKKPEVSLARPEVQTQHLVDVIQSTENLVEGSYGRLGPHEGHTHLCSDPLGRPPRDNPPAPRPPHGGDTAALSHPSPRGSRQQVVAEIHRSVGGYSPTAVGGDLQEPQQQEMFIHCRKCRRPHGIYNDDFMEHYDESDDNVFDEPDLIKDSQVKGQGQVEVSGGGQPDPGEEEVESDESVYGIREQIYSTTEELQNDAYVCSNCARREAEQKCPGCKDNVESRSNLQQNRDPGCQATSDTVYSTTQEQEAGKKRGKVAYWKRYVTMGNYRKRVPNRKSDKPASQSLEVPVPEGISYSTVSTRLSPNTQLLLDGRHYKTLPIDLITPVRPSGLKKPFGYDKLELSTAKTAIRSQYTMTELQSSLNQSDPSLLQSVAQSETSSASLSQSESRPSVPRFRCVIDPADPKPRSVSCSDILEETRSSSRDAQSKPSTRSRAASASGECDYIFMSQKQAMSGQVRSLPVSKPEVSKPELSASELALQKKKAKILKAISKNRSRDASGAAGQPSGGGHAQQQRARVIPMTDNDIYSCDAETKRKIHILTRNKLSSTWNGSRPPPKDVLTRHSTLPHSFSPTPQQNGGASGGTMTSSSPWQPALSRSSDSLLVPKQLSSRDFHTLSKNSGFPGSLYLRPGAGIQVQLQNRLKDQKLKRRRFASSTDCLLSSAIAEEDPPEDATPRPPAAFPRRRSLSYDAGSERTTPSHHSYGVATGDGVAGHQTYTNAAAIARNAAASYKRRHNPILSDLMRVNNDRQTLMLV